jgi:hypothetical protein
MVVRTFQGPHHSLKGDVKDNGQATTGGRRQVHAQAVFKHLVWVVAALDSGGSVSVRFSFSHQESAAGECHHSEKGRRASQGWDLTCFSVSHGLWGEPVQ